MSGRYSLADLASDAGLAGSGSGDEGGSGSAHASASDGAGDGEWLGKFLKEMKDEGYLDLLLKHHYDIGEPRSMDDIAGETAEVEPVENNGEPQGLPDGGGAELSAQTLKRLMLELYDNADMIPGLSEDPTLSELIQFVDANPDLVDQLADQYL